MSRAVVASHPLLPNKRLAASRIRSRVADFASAVILMKVGWLVFRRRLFRLIHDENVERYLAGLQLESKLIPQRRYRNTLKVERLTRLGGRDVGPKIELEIIESGKFCRIMHWHLERR